MPSLPAVTLELGLGAALIKGIQDTGRHETGYRGGQGEGPHSL